MQKPLALLLKFPGTNSDVETARALETVGFATRTLAFNAFTAEDLEDTHLLVFPGGFSYGDYVMAGRLARLELSRKVGDAIPRFIENGGHALGICNGFQILTQLGLLPEGSLIENSSGRFQCNWVGLENHTPDNAFLMGLPKQFELPIAHAEGRFVIPEDKAEEFLASGLVTLSYTKDVNGSTSRIAGIQDASGRVFGLMPHPERFMTRHHHYDREWRAPDGGDAGWGHLFFQSIFNRITEEAGTCAAL